MACQRTGVTGLTLHDLRYCYASGLVAARCDVVTVQHAPNPIANDDLEHRRPPVADRRGPHPQSRRRTVHGRDGCFCHGPTTAPNHQLGI